MAIEIYRDDGYAVWSEVEPEGTYSGRCIGVGETERAALEDAKRELIADLNVVLAHIDRLTQPLGPGRRRYVFTDE